MLSGSPNATYTSDSPTCVSYRPIVRISTNRGMMSAAGGIISPSRMSRNSTSDPRKRSRAKPYAASTLRTVVTTTEATVTMMLLTNSVPRPNWFQASMKFSGRRLLGITERE